ncbi:ArsR/SmtB family transcription factor [Salinarchaeum laminariae]|uniref:ArsR/SmtB family transcription factor n=1 Tax=Salinarchaeum laminariae TaxID=869888 RepID=UPI0020C0B5DF|nr:helix-turn-helix domain-containing protein [Salinarchaeum laminariae]
MAREPVDDPSVVESTLAALGGKYAARILSAADRPVSAQELSDELAIPIATCYRRIEELEAAGLLVCEGQQTSKRGRRTSVYRRTIDGADLGLDGDGATLDLEESDSPAGSDGTRPNGT